LVWHYHDDEVPGTSAGITLDLTGAPDGSPEITRTLIDEGHSNSFNAWLAMDSPQSPTADQIRELEEASKLASADDKPAVKSADGHCEVSFPLARKGVTLVELEWP
jgi:xylan 1,4-beta-xylosidase